MHALSNLDPDQIKHFVSPNLGPNCLQRLPADAGKDLATHIYGRVNISFHKTEDVNLILRERGLPWFGHMERSSGAVRTACDIQIDGRWGAGRSKLTWEKLTEKDCHEWKLTTVDPQERSTWRSGV